MSNMIMLILDNYLYNEYMFGSRHLNGANYIANFERQTSGGLSGLEPIGFSFPSSTSLYDSIAVNLGNRLSKEKSNVVLSKHEVIPDQDSTSKSKGRSSNKRTTS